MYISCNLCLSITASLCLKHKNAIYFVLFFVFVFWVVLFISASALLLCMDESVITNQNGDIVHRHDNKKCPIRPHVSNSVFSKTLEIKRTRFLFWYFSCPHHNLKRSQIPAFCAFFMCTLPPSTTSVTQAKADRGGQYGK